MNRKTLAMALLALALVALAPRPVQALSVGSPAGTNDQLKLSLSGSLAYSTFEIDNTDVNTRSFLFKGAYGSSESVTPYLKLGFADLEVDDVSFEGSLDFAIGGGVTFGFLKPQGDSGLEAALDAQVLWWDSTDGGQNLDIFHGQVSILAVMKGGGTDPYLGMASNYISVDGAGLDESESGQAHLFFGVDYYMDYNLFFNLEAHLFNENTISVGVGYLF